MGAVIIAQYWKVVGTRFMNSAYLQEFSVVISFYVQHGGGTCHLSPITGTSEAPEGREQTREEPLSHPTPSLVVESCSPAGFAAPEQSDAVEICSVSHGRLVLAVGAAALAQVKTSKSSEFSFRRAALGPGALLTDTWAQLSQQPKTANPTFASQIPPLEG